MSDRRAFLQLAAAGAGAVFASALPGGARAAERHGDFHFVQMSDSHWGYVGPANPESTTTLPRAVDAVNQLQPAPDFVMFTGDLTHTTDDPMERRRRMAEFRRIVAALKVPEVRFMPGEHDAALDGGAAYQELFGALYYSFDHKGLHFIALDNVSDPGARLGEAQLDWLAQDLQAQSADTPVVVFSHRPLFDLAPEWDWATRDGAAARAILARHPLLTVFYGHIHQAHHAVLDRISHHAARSLIFPLPAPQSQPKRAPLPWDPEHPRAGLGFRSVHPAAPGAAEGIAEIPLERG